MSDVIYAWESQREDGAWVIIALGEGLEAAPLVLNDLGGEGLRHPMVMESLREAMSTALAEKEVRLHRYIRDPSFEEEIDQDGSD